MEAIAGWGGSDNAPTWSRWKLRRKKLELVCHRGWGTLSEGLAMLDEVARVDLTIT